MSYADVGVVFELPGGAAELKKHIAKRGLFAGCKGVTFHHTWEPDLAMRPQGLTAQHIQNLADYYRGKLGWSAGPHFFVDDLRVSCMTPCSEHGVHAKSFNSTHIGIEVLGNYDKEDPNTGRGLKAWQNAVLLGVELVKVMDGAHGVDTNFHRDDPKTDKTCPGQKVTREFISILARETPNWYAEKAAQAQSQTRLLKLEQPGITVWWDTEQKQVMVPAADFLRADGRDASWDSGAWKQLQGTYYDRETETTYAPLNELVALTMRA